MYTPYEQRKGEIPFASSEYISFASRNSFLGVPAVTMDDLGDGSVVILGAPFDWGTTYRPGARFGPRRSETPTTGQWTDTGPTFPPGSTRSRHWVWWTLGMSMFDRASSRSRSGGSPTQSNRFPPPTSAHRPRW